MKKIFLNLLFFILSLKIYSSDIDVNNMIPLNLSSQKINIEKIINQKNKKLLFMTTWCHNCKDKIQDIELKNLTDNYIYIFGNYGSDNIEKASAFAETHPQLKYIFFDNNSILKEKFNIKIVPSEVNL